MKITILYYGKEYSINTNPLIDCLSSDDLDDTSVREALDSFKSLLLSLTFCEKNIDEAIVDMAFENDATTYCDDEDD
jgi:hypothetical protein